MKVSVECLIQLFLFNVPTFAAPALKTVVRYSGETVPGSYIVTLKSNIHTTAHLDRLSLSTGSEITHQYNGVLNGFAGNFTEADLSLLRAHGDVESIEEDGIFYALQTDAPWGLGRISSKTKLADQDSSHLTFTYNYDPSAGAGADVYVVDTGIYITHPEFGGRASWGVNFVPGEGDTDGNGHGTHCAGLAISTRYGVAKAARAIAVKVLSSSGSGTTANIISGIQWIATAAKTSGRPSVASFSIGGGASASLDAAVASLIAGGVPVTVASGNSALDASNFSPARVPTAFTVGPTSIADVVPSGANYGSVLDIYAPGVNIISTWLNGVTNTISGSSASAAYTAGLIAYFFGLGYTPGNVGEHMKSCALSGVLTGVPDGTANLLINNCYTP